jgi:putative transposase
MLPPGETILLTLRLAGSIPVRAARELHAQHVAAKQAADSPEAHRRAEKQFFAGFDALLDARTIGSDYLTKEKLAETVASELLMLEEQGLRVLCFVLLPNHLHAVLHLPLGQSVSLYKTIELLHQRTATQARRLLRGQFPPEADFWQTGFHELPVLDAAELSRIQQYPLGHPQSLSLPERFKDWPYVYGGDEGVR